MIKYLRSNAVAPVHGHSNVVFLFKKKNKQEENHGHYSGLILFTIRIEALETRPYFIKTVHATTLRC